MAQQRAGRVDGILARVRTTLVLILAALSCAGCVAHDGDRRAAGAPAPPVAAAADAGASTPAPAPARLLVYTQTLGWRHDSIPAAVEALRALAEVDGVDVVHGEDPAAFDDDTLAQYAAVAFVNTTGPVLDARQRAAFERFVAAGGGFIGVHSAADTGYDWPWYGTLVGAWFLSHPPGLQRTRVTFTRGHAPAGGDGWRITDEIYDYRAPPRPALTVIARVDERDYDGGRMGADHPIAWCHDEAGGRAWYTGLGHDAAVYAEPVFRGHLQRGLRWVLGRAERC